MSGEGSMVGGYLKRKAALKLIAKVGKLKLLAAAAVALAAFLIFLVMLAALAGATDSSSSPEGPLGCTFGGGSPGSGEAAVEPPPPAYVPIYMEAAERFHLGPRGPGILAAINYVESDYGQSTLPGVAPGTQNEMGAEGPMQFLESSWEAYGLDGDGNGVADAYNETDAVFAAAHLLHVDGAPKDWYGAIFDYNHADWYVRKVEHIAAGYGAMQCSPSPVGDSETLQRLVSVARWIEAQKIHYCWGGGHGEKPGPSPGSGEFCPAGTQGLDCSGAVRWLLVLTGYPDPGPLVSGSFAGSNSAPTHLPGPGAAVTIWSNVDHVFIEIDGEDWGTSRSNFANGPGFGSQPTAGFGASHPEGL